MRHPHAEPERTQQQPAPAVAPVKLSDTVGGWTRAGASERIEPASIFQYMDGAGELYLAYRFDHLDVIEYRTTAEREGNIVVEIYWMRGSDDAFGLLSNDWGGEPVSLDAAPTPAAGEAAAWPRALYGAGLLRLWTDTIYARVLASRETAAARSAVLALGRAIALGRGAPAPPALASALPPEIGGGLRLRRDSVCFLRSHLVLNSAYFLSQQDVLELGLDVAAVTARYEPSAASGATPAAGGHPRLVLLRYPDAARAGGALARFLTAYLPERKATDGNADRVAAKIEDGWMAARRRSELVAIVLECPAKAAADALAAAGLDAADRKEVAHD